MNQSDYQRTKKGFRDYLKSKPFTNKSIESRRTAFDQYLKWTERENLDIGQAGYNDLLLFMKHCQHKDISKKETELNLELMRLMDEHCLDHPYKGAARMHNLVDP